MLFREFCSACEEICLSKRSEKLDRLKKLLRECRQRILDDPNLTTYSVMRLLLPHLDRSRASYGIKEASLAKLYIKIFCLPKDGPDAIRLLTYKYYKQRFIVPKWCIIFMFMLLCLGYQKLHKLWPKILQTSATTF